MDSYWDKARDTTQEFEIEPEQSGSARRLRAYLVMLTGSTPGKIFALKRQDYIVGRDQEADLCLKDEGLSRQHARIRSQGGRHVLEDLGSTNGTFVNGNRMTTPVVLSDGDRFQIGVSSIFKYALQDEIEFAAARKLYESTVRDGLTGVHNRHYLDERLHAEVSFALRQESPLTLLMVDIDFFKKINDEHGHQVGDETLKVVASILKRQLRIEDVVARYGGEEFMIIARGTDIEKAAVLAERLRVQIELQAIPVERNVISVTVSIGMAELGRKYPNAAAVVGAADAALYKAKAAGRNRVCVAD